MTYDFARYARELVEVVRLSDKPGWSAERAARMYLEHAHAQGYGEALDAALGSVEAAFREFTQTQKVNG